MTQKSPDDVFTFFKMATNDLYIFLWIMICIEKTYNLSFIITSIMSMYNKADVNKISTQYKHFL